MSLLLRIITFGLMHAMEKVKPLIIVELSGTSRQDSRYIKQYRYLASAVPTFACDDSPM
jgi:hypothetical protein